MGGLKVQLLWWQVWFQVIMVDTIKVHYGLMIFIFTCMWEVLHSTYMVQIWYQIIMGRKLCGFSPNLLRFWALDKELITLSKLLRTLVTTLNKNIDKIWILKQCILIAEIQVLYKQVYSIHIVKGYINLLPHVVVHRCSLVYCLVIKLLHK